RRLSGAGGGSGRDAKSASRNFTQSGFDPTNGRCLPILMPLTYQSLYFDAAMTPQRVMDVFTPVDVTQSAAFFFVHGGGWRGGTRAIFHPIIAALLKEGFICATTDYRLKGVHIGDQIMDMRHGYTLFMRQLAALGRPQRAVVYGS